MNAWPHFVMHTYNATSMVVVNISSGEYSMSLMLLYKQRKSIVKNNSSLHYTLHLHES